LQPSEPPPTVARPLRTLYVEMMGGAEKIIAFGRELHDEGKYFLAQEIVNKPVQAEPPNQVAKDLLADIFEQLGYQQENPGLRYSFLAGAYELRTGIPVSQIARRSTKRHHMGDAVLGALARHAPAGFLRAGAD
jgi:alkyl sulfatase BDS1-like metallo-beta-lactamase superfamily hydrolase